MTSSSEETYDGMVVAYRAAIKEARIGMSSEERYLNDATYNQFVNALENMLQNDLLTSGELRDGVDLAIRHHQIRKEGRDLPEVDQAIKRFCGREGS